MERGVRFDAHLGLAFGCLTWHLAQYWWGARIKDLAELDRVDPIAALQG